MPTGLLNTLALDIPQSPRTGIRAGREKGVKRFDRYLERRVVEKIAGHVLENLLPLGRNLDDQPDGNAEVPAQLLRAQPAL